MKIAVAQRYRPFSHLPGIECLVPGSLFVLKAFPSLLQVKSLEGVVLAELHLDISAPVHEFTLIQDLENPSVKISGKTAKGFFRYEIAANLDLLSLNLKKFPFSYTNSSPELLQVSIESDFKAQTFERLALGMHKSLDWDLVKRRGDLREILPVWYKLGQLVPPTSESGQETLLNELKEAIFNKDKRGVLATLEALFLTGFKGILVPQIVDNNFHGYKLPPCHNSAALLSAGYSLIQKLFFSNDQNAIELLPLLPNSFVFGKLTAAKIPHWGILDLEWSKEKIRQAIFKCESSGPLVFKFPKSIKQSRLRLNDKEKGYTLKSGETFDVEEGKTYFFDRFI